MPSVLLCSDEPVLAEGLQRILESVNDLDLCSHCSDFDELEASLATHDPDVLLLDLTSELHFGVLAKLQRAVSRTKIVLWVHSISTELALQAMSLGVRGVLRKSLPTEKLIRCLSRVQEGELWFEKALTDSLMSAKRYRLTPREGQLVTLLSQGLKNKEIATALNISEGTVKVYLSRLFQKLGVKDRFELALYGLKNLTSGTGAPDRHSEHGSEPVPAPRAFFLDRLPVHSERGNRPIAITG
jgi:DNA-binding NarL/FixJ family response regulator